MSVLPFPVMSQGCQQVVSPRNDSKSPIPSPERSEGIRDRAMLIDQDASVYGNLYPSSFHCMRTLTHVMKAMSERSFLSKLRWRTWLIVAMNISMIPVCLSIRYEILLPLSRDWVDLWSILDLAGPKG